MRSALQLQLLLLPIPKVASTCAGIQDEAAGSSQRACLQPGTPAAGPRGQTFQASDFLQEWSDGAGWWMADNIFSLHWLALPMHRRSYSAFSLAEGKASKGSAGSRSERVMIFQLQIQ